MVGAETPLMASGLDSIAVSELVHVFAKQVSQELPATMLFDHPTISAVATFIISATAPGTQACVATDVSRTAGARPLAALAAARSSCAPAAEIASLR